MKIIDYSENNGKFNMEFDSNLLKEAINSQSAEPVLRFYGWKPACVSLGRNQSENSINTEYCLSNGIDIVKRVTGGRALLHNDELTYSFICRQDFLENGESVINSYKEISSAIIDWFKNLNIELEFGGRQKVNTSHDYCMLLSTGADLVYKNKKLIGSAQYRTNGYILQHGSILFNYDPLQIKNIFGEDVFQSITCINEINSSIQRSDVAESMKYSFLAKFGKFDTI